MKKALVSVVIVTKDRKNDLIECTNSYIKSTYKPIEIIVIDNASKPSLLTWLPKKYPKVKLITSDKNLGAASGRNLGFDHSKGEYILFTDDDAVCDKDMITQLVKVFEDKNEAGIVQPLVYDKHRKNMLQGAGHDIDLTTGRIRASGVKEVDRGQYDGLREVPMCGCVWMVKREVFEKIGSYDPDYFIPYEDCDFSVRARNAGFKLYCISLGKTWHRGPKNTFVHPWIEWLGITSPERAYRIARNKMIFMRKNSPFPNNLIFFFLFLPIYTLAHSLIILLTGKFDIFLKYWLGVISGVWYAITFPVRDIVRSNYRKIDKLSRPIKMFLIATTDPVNWVIDTKSESILDLGCGPGKLMEFIKFKMKVRKAVGVDLFAPYIEEGKLRKTHDQFILEDVRKVKFNNKSFDIVLASHVLEHLGKNDAWKLLSNMEKWAKRQVIVATPIGEHYHPPEDGNPLQLHHSAFQPEDFEKRGYKILKYGWKWLLGDKGLVHKIDNDLIRKIIYTFNILITPILYLFQESCDYIFVAIKRVDEKL